jgi:hypothetical protein
MKAGLLVALSLSAVFVIGGCTQEEEAGSPEESSEGTTEETTAGPARVERTIIKETTVVVPAPAAAPSPEQASSPSPESQQVAGSEPAASEVEIPIEIDNPHDGTVVPCYQDPVCSSEQARIQSEHVAELEAAKMDGLPPSQNLLDMCTHAVRSKTGLPKACWSVGE